MIVPGFTLDADPLPIFRVIVVPAGPFQSNFALRLPDDGAGSTRGVPVLAGARSPKLCWSGAR